MRKKKEFLLINLGLILLAIDIHFFKTPNGFALGGTSGLSIIITKYFPDISVGISMTILNILFLLLSIPILGKKFTLNTIYGSLALSLIVEVLDILCPIKHPLTNQKFMELIYSVFLPGIGNAVIFNYNSSTGGTDILGKMINKIFKIKMSIAMLVLDFVIALGAGLAFGIETCLLALLGVFMKSFVLDSFTESLRIFKIVVIITDQTDKVQDFICNHIKRGATIHIARGAFTNKEHYVITTILSRKQAILLQNYIHEIDDKAFVSISNSSRIIGNGFERFD
jgi:uncharacterized membrane-anchored protein YitT (DUF2179 family)